MNVEATMVCSDDPAHGEMVDLAPDGAGYAIPYCYGCLHCRWIRESVRRLNEYKSRGAVASKA